MANSPSVSVNYPGAAAINATDAHAGYYRVVRIQKHVDECFVSAASPAAAVAAAQALAPNGGWKKRPIYQFQPGLEDTFEYNAVCSDPATPVYNTDQV